MSQRQQTEDNNPHCVNVNRQMTITRIVSTSTDRRQQPTLCQRQQTEDNNPHCVNIRRQ